MSTLIRCVAIVFLAHVLLVTPVRAQDGDITISEINIEGAKRVSPSTILS